MYYEICYYYVDDNQNIKFYTIEEARAYAKELSRELKYYPSVKMVAYIPDGDY